MRRAGDFWQRLISFENLHRAARLTLKGKRSRPEASGFFSDLEGNLIELRFELENGLYRPGGYRTFWITDPKPRLISAASFCDRVVHHALVSVIEPVFERRFIHHSYACRKGKGNHRALDRFVGWARSSRYVLKLDIKKFFPSIDHQVLKSTLRRVLKDRRVLELCDLIIDGSNTQEPVALHFPGDGLLSPLERRRGIPIGNLTSQFFANVYLDSLDHFVKERLKVGRYLRYVDDLACFGDDKRSLRDLREEISVFLTGLRLRFNEGKSRIRRVKEGIEFLGFIVLPDRLRLNSSNTRRMRRRIKLLQRNYSEGSISWDDVSASLQAWNAHASYGDTWRLRGDVFRAAVFTPVSPPGRPGRGTTASS